MSLKQLSSVNSYRVFMAKRDAFLEKILLKHRAKTSDLLKKFMTKCLEELRVEYPAMGNDITDAHTIQAMRKMGLNLERHAYETAIHVAKIWYTMRQQVYQFSYASGQKAALNIGVGSGPRSLKRSKMDKVVYDPTELGPVFSRSYLATSRLATKVMDSIKVSLIMNRDIREASDAMLKVFPSPDKLTKNLVLRRLTEAKKPEDEEDYEFIKGPEFIDQEEWEQILEEYNTEHVPYWRDPRYTIEELKADETVVYPWEVENEMMEDFVAKVSEGEVDAANELGITQFVWIAVLDKKTDECCIKRNGLTNTEIADKLKNEWANDKCRATVSPAHFSCRCRAAAATDKLPEKPASNAQDFEEWLNT